MRARWCSRTVGWLVMAGVLAGAAPRAEAQSASVQAQSLFDDARKLLAAGKVAEACAAFDASQKLDPAVTTLLNLADCRERNHQLATAWGWFVEAGRTARASNNAKLARVAGNHASKLEPRLSKVTIAVAADHQLPGLEIVRGDEPMNPASWNHALPVDGGSYTISARAPGHAPWSITRVVRVEGDNQRIEIPALRAAEAAVAAAPRAATRPAHASAAPSPAAANPAHTGPVSPPAATNPAHAGPASPPAAATEVPAGSRVAAGQNARATPHHGSSAVPLAFGLGALALGGGAFALDLAGNAKYDDAKHAAVQSQRDALYDQANTRRYLAEGLGVAAIACAGTAAYLYFHLRSERQSDSMELTPIAGPQRAGLAVVGYW